MTTLRPGDRVSLPVAGVVELSSDGWVTVKIDVPDTAFTRSYSAKVWHADLTFIEHASPVRHRIGSVWERWGVRWVVGADDGVQQLVNLTNGATADIRLIEASPDAWREVPVEELERELDATRTAR